MVGAGTVVVGGGVEGSSVAGGGFVVAGGVVVGGGGVVVVGGGVGGLGVGVGGAGMGCVPLLLFLYHGLRPTDSR